MKFRTLAVPALLGLVLAAGAYAADKPVRAGAAAESAKTMTPEKYDEYLRLFNSGDDRYAELYAEDVVFDHGPFYGILNGRQAIVDFYRDIRTKLKETVTASAVVIDNEHSIMAAELTTRLEATKDGVKLASRTLNKGEVFTSRGVVFYGLRDGRIVTIRGAIAGGTFEPAATAKSGRDSAPVTGNQAR